MKSSKFELPPDLLRRLREYQVKVRELTRSSRPLEHAAVPTRGPLSGRQLSTLERLKAISPSLAASLEQVLRDLNDSTRLSYVGPAGELREVMRSAIQLLAPDSEVRNQPWFVGVRRGEKTQPTQAERTRLAVQKQRGNADQLKDSDDLVDSLVGKISRETYAVGSKTFHAGAAQSNVLKLTGWVFAILDEVLPP